MASSNPRIVIVGGGFAGLAAARQLKGEDVDITLVDRSNHHLFQPLLYQVAMAGLSPADIAIPIRAVLRRQPNARVLLGEVTRVDFNKQVVLLDEPRGEIKTSATEVPYDYLILATGVKTNYFGRDDWARRSLGMKNLDDAVEVRRRVLLAFEAAERATDPRVIARLLTFVVIGGGPTGVELAGALRELADHALGDDFRRIDPTATRVVLIEAQDRLLPGGFSQKLSGKAQSQLEELGVEVRVNTRVEEMTDEGVVIGDEMIESATVLWTAGVRGRSLTERLEAEHDRAGRVIVDDTCRITGEPRVFALGDMAHFKAEDGQPLAGVAPVAMQQGRYAAKALLQLERGKTPKPFKYFDKGMMATVGRSRAVAETGRLKWSGLLAWLAWLVIHIAYLVGFRNRFVVMFQWFWSYVTYRRGARLITGDRAWERMQKLASHDHAKLKPATPSPDTANEPIDAPPLSRG